ncbi:MAG: hypothetical protein WEB04_05165 [Dehalococcoidia bacterium]
MSSITAGGGMSGIAVVASRVARGWTAAYTLGLAAQVRDARRAEIASDVWEHHRDIVTEERPMWRFFGSVFGRIVRGAPADVLWRVNVEGPKMDIKIPFERIVGGLLLAMVVLLMITTSISGYDTGREGFDGELRRLADMSGAAHNVNAFFRAITGVALIAAAAALYTNLKDRSPMLSAMAAFGIAAAGVLALIAGALQLVFVELAQEYVASTGAHQEQVLVTARGFAVATENTVGGAFIALVLSIYVLAILAGREALVPRWLIGIPVISAVVIGGSLIAQAVGADLQWWILISGLFMSVIWLLIAGLWLLLSPSKGRAPASAGHAAAM